MILNTITEKLNRQAKDDFTGRPLEAWLIMQAVTIVPALSSELPRSRKHVSRTRF